MGKSLSRGVALYTGKNILPVPMAFLSWFETERVKQLRADKIRITPEVNKRGVKVCPFGNTETGLHIPDGPGGEYLHVFSDISEHKTL